MTSTRPPRVPSTSEQEDGPKHLDAVGLLRQLARSAIKQAIHRPLSALCSGLAQASTMRPSKGKGYGGWSTPSGGRGRLAPGGFTLPTPSMLGMAASAAETKMRTDKAMQTSNPLDKLQAGIAGTSLAADAVPIVGEAVSTPADLANVAIDEGRELFSDPKTYTQRALERTAQVTGQMVLGTPAMKAINGGMKLLFK